MEKEVTLNGSEEMESDLAGKTDDELELLLVDDDGNDEILLEEEEDPNHLPSEEEGDHEEKKEEPHEEEEEEEPSETEKLMKRLTDKEEMIQRQGNELGELRRIVRQMQLNNLTPKEKETTKEEELKPEDFWADPIAAVKKLTEGSKKPQEDPKRAEMLRELVAEEIKNHVPNFDDIKPRIADLAEEDGFDKTQVASFRENGMGDPLFVKGMAARIALADENDALKKENEELKQRLEKEGISIAKKIDEAARHSAKKRLNTSNQSSGKKRVITVSELSELPDADLDALLAKAR